ncbi:MAG: ComEC/Rec2 family competence protein [Iamia sp.]
MPAAPVPIRAFGAWGAVALAGATAGGALVGRPVALAAPLVVALVAALARRPALLVVAAALAASGLAARADAGMDPPRAGEVVGEVTLVSDPEARWGGVEAVGRLDGRLVLVVAEGTAAQVVRLRLAGERLRVTGRLGPLPDDVDWLRVRHVAGRLVVREAAPGTAASVPWRAANHVRRTLRDGAAGMGDDRRSLFVGLVLGDDRDQTPEMTDDFRGSGLSHLLAVSGQNVAFILAIAAPVLRRVRPAGRIAVVAALLALFATVTRFEPSVLRAVAMAGAATVATMRGRPTTGVHLLALAVTGLVLVDPFLVRSVGFQLSVAATAGIAVLAPWFVRVLPGPPALVLPVAVTAAAQLGVAPLLVAVFGGVPVSSLPANVLAAPAAALVMTWGLPAGLLAGLAPPLAGILHAPTSVALGWIEGVARRAASVPLGELGPGHLLALGAALGLAGLAIRSPGHVRRSTARPVDRARPGGRRWAVATSSVALATAALAAPALAFTRPPVHSAPEVGVDVWRAHGSVVVAVAPGTGARSTLEGLRRAGVTQVDVLVVGPGSAAGDEERAARHRSRVGRVHWLGRDPPSAVRVGGLVVAATDEGVCVAPVLTDLCPRSRSPSGG